MKNDENLALDETTKFIQSKISMSPDIAVVLGSGLAPLAELIEEPTVIDYDEIPHFATSTVEGHAGKLICGKLQGKYIVCMNGRFHFYEGYGLDIITYPMKVFKQLGIQTLFLTNAVGGINTQFKAGDFMIISDHLNLMGSNPLIGPNNDLLGTRFPDMTEVYSQKLRNIAEEAGKKLGIKLQKGVFCALTGPCYETPAEINMLRLLGADAVGMSTVPEAIVANYMKMEVLGISCVTNAAAGMEDGQVLSHDDVKKTAELVKNDFTRLVSLIIKNIEVKK